MRVNGDTMCHANPTERWSQRARFFWRSKISFGKGTQQIWKCYDCWPGKLRQNIHSPTSIYNTFRNPACTSFAWVGAERILDLERFQMVATSYLLEWYAAWRPTRSSACSENTLCKIHSIRKGHSNLLHREISNSIHQERRDRRTRNWNDDSSLEGIQFQLPDPRGATERHTSVPKMRRKSYSRMIPKILSIGNNSRAFFFSMYSKKQRYTTDFLFKSTVDIVTLFVW